MKNKLSELNSKVLALRLELMKIHDELEKIESEASESESESPYLFTEDQIISFVKEIHSQFHMAVKDSIKSNCISFNIEFDLYNSSNDQARISAEVDEEDIKEQVIDNLPTIDEDEIMTMINAFIYNLKTPNNQ